MKKVLIAVCAITLMGATAAMAKEAAEVYKTVCSQCHGLKGEGKKMLGPAHKGNEFVIKSSVDDIKHVIKEGRAGDKKKYEAKLYPAAMPPQTALTDAELDALVKYLKGELQKD